MRDLIDRRVAIDAICEDGTQRERQGQYSMTMVERKQRDVDILENLPSAQPDVPDTNVGDTISRQAAISEIMEDIKDRSLHDDPGTPEDYAEGYDEGIRNAAVIVLQMPSAQPGWIPCDSGKFPEESGTYTVTAYDGATKRVTYAKYQKRLKRWELTGARAYWRVLAWMPHIEPYKEKQDE